MYMYARYVRGRFTAVGGCSHGQVNPIRSSDIRTGHCVCDCPNESTGVWTTVSVLVDSKGNNKDSLLILSFPVLLLQAYEEQCGILTLRFRCKST